MFVGRISAFTRLIVIVFDLSSGFFNPAVALAGAVLGDIGWKRFAVCVSAEMVGGFLAALFTWFTYVPHFQPLEIVQQSQDRVCDCCDLENNGVALIKQELSVPAYRYLRHWSSLHFNLFSLNVIEFSYAELQMIACPYFWAWFLNTSTPTVRDLIKSVGSDIWWKGDDLILVWAQSQGFDFNENWMRCGLGLSCANASWTWLHSCFYSVDLCIQMNLNAWKVENSWEFCYFILGMRLRGHGSSIGFWAQSNWTRSKILCILYGMVWNLRYHLIPSCDWSWSKHWL